MRESVDIARAGPGEDDSAGADPLRSYLRTLKAFSLLSRDGEIEVAKRIDDARRRVLHVVLGSPVGIDQILSLRDELRAGKVRVKDVVGNLEAHEDAHDDDLDEQWHAERVCDVLGQVRRLRPESGKRTAASTAARRRIVDRLWSSGCRRSRSIAIGPAYLTELRVSVAERRILGHDRERELARLASAVDTAEQQLDRLRRQLASPGGGRRWI